LARIETANRYARTKKSRFRRSSTALRVTALIPSATSTIILGLQNLDFWAGLGFSLVAVTTVVNAVEPFFAWRSRWVLMEETQYRFYRLRDDVTFYIASTPAGQLDAHVLKSMFEQYQNIWDQLGSRWLETRRPSAPSQ